MDAQRFRSWNVTAIAGLVATVTPVTAGVHGYFEKERDVVLQSHRLEQEMELETLKQTNAMRISYLDRMREPAEQGRVLRIAMIAAAKPEIKAWAEDELERVEAEIAALKEELTKRDAEATQAWHAALQSGDARQRTAILIEMAQRKSDVADRLAAEIGHWHGRAAND